MLDTRVLSFRVFTDQHRVHVVVRGFVSLDRHARSYVSEEVERSTEGQVEGDVALSDYNQN